MALPFLPHGRKEVDAERLWEMDSEACEWKEDESPQGASESALWGTDVASKSYTVWLDGKSVGRSHGQVAQTYSPGQAGKMPQ